MLESDYANFSVGECFLRRDQCFAVVVCEFVHGTGSNWLCLSPVSNFFHLFLESATVWEKLPPPEDP